MSTTAAQTLIFRLTLIIMVCVPAEYAAAAVDNIISIIMSNVVTFCAVMGMQSCICLFADEKERLHAQSAGC